MKRIQVAGVGLLALTFASSPTSAADIPVRPVTKAPPPAAVPIYNWSGCYVGGHAGWARGELEWTTTTNTSGWGDNVAGQGFSQHGSGFAGGGHLGCNWQPPGPWVYGIEGSFTWTNIEEGFNNTVFGAADDVYNWELNHIATLTARIGYAWDRWLLYARAGYAGAKVKLSVLDTTPTPPGDGVGSDSAWHHGWTAGIGSEYAFAPNWIFGLEYNYYRLNTKSYELGDPGALYTFDVRPRPIHSVLARVSFKW